ncbi:hypothetical protein FACS189490_12170 [Clostridia bacterium]|nr:hypothetical protein FACS189490_12170 [Clostridia bacterium]
MNFMAEKPILFSTPMVQAILAGRKTQTRRVIGDDFVHNSDGTATPIERWIPENGMNNFVLFAPIQVGDTLWVRETWARSEGTGSTYYDIQGG